MIKLDNRLWISVQSEEPVQDPNELLTKKFTLRTHSDGFETKPYMLIRTAQGYRCIYDWTIPMDSGVGVEEVIRLYENMTKKEIKQIKKLQSNLEKAEYDHDNKDDSYYVQFTLAKEAYTKFIREIEIRLGEA